MGYMRGDRGVYCY